MTYPNDDETTEQYTQRMMDWYGAKDPLELAQIMEDESYGHEEYSLGLLVDKLTEGVNINFRDIAYALRSCSRVVWPKELREYTAALLMGEVEGSQNNAMFSKNGRFLSPDFLFSTLEKQVCVSAIDFLVGKGFSVRKAVTMLGRAHALQLIDLGSPCLLQKIVELSPEDVDHCWKRCDDMDVMAQREKESERWANKLKHYHKKKD